MKPFNILDAPLHGYNIIEASAGTGKTYAIADLFLRLIIEHDLRINEILVVTFTEAATEELRDRIRKRLKAASGVLTGSNASLPGDALLEWMRIRYKDNSWVKRRLHTALIEFDSAAICTIHSFCQRMLRDNAFESNALFDTELIADQTEYIREIVDDFWRSNFYTASPQFIQYILHKKYSPDTFLELMRRQSIDPELCVIPPVDKPDIDRVQTAVQQSYDQLSASWQSDRSAVADILLHSAALKRTRYSIDSMESLLQEMDEYLRAGLLFPLCSKYEKFTASYIAASVKKNSTPPQHPFFERCEEFINSYTRAAAAFDQYLLFLKEALFDYVKQELTCKKRALNVRSFDDLLEDLHRALKREQGALARVIRSKFKAALIDEFQDTDSVQYAIFNTIFGSGDHILFMIGDPKQAIYRFRGADIFTYLKASSQVQDSYTLTTNWRSDAPLISAINEVFSRAENPFVFNWIKFHDIQAAEKNSSGNLLIEGNNEPPLHIWFIDRQFADKEDGTVNKGSAEPLIAQTVASEILRLIVLGQQHKAQIDNRALSPGDIAVLVRKNKQARMVQEALQQLSIPSVLYGAESIFVSHEAQEVARVITAIAEPGDEAKIKAALATDIFGMSGNDLQALTGNESAWETLLARFHAYHDYWEEHGFIRMFRQLIKDEGVRTRMLSYQDGERRMTNLLHCTEVLHRAEHEENLGMERLIKWFSERRNTESNADENQLRLETDENAVKLITIHRSKGLEYPVVFCPFAWDSAEVNTKQFSFHDPTHDNRLTLDLGSGIDEHRIRAVTEELAENVRLLYVALTRAKHRCYLVWGKINDTETSAPAYLFHKPESFSTRDIVNELGHRVKGLSYDEMRNEIGALQKMGGNIVVSHLPVAHKKPYAPLDISPDVLTSRTFTRAIARDWMIASYSSLIANKRSGDAEPDYDNVFDTGAITPPDSEGSDIFTFPRGAVPGSCVHALFENLDFSCTAPAPVKQLIEEKLSRYGLEQRWQDTLWQMVRQVVSMPLEHDWADLTLTSVCNGERLNELEFYFPLARITSAGLADVFARHGLQVLTRDVASRMAELGFSPVEGFIRGFIDLVFRHAGRFYLIDWKSNYLGGSTADYCQDALQKAMNEHYYILQYHLYTVALHRYLSLRIPAYDYETHFGGVYYIFVRGVNHDYGSNYGIYRDIPLKSLIIALSDYFAGAPGE